MTTQLRLIVVATLVTIVALQSGCAVATHPSATGSASTSGETTPASQPTPSVTASEPQPPDYCKEEPNVGGALGKDLLLSATEAGRGWELYTDVGGYQPYRDCVGGVPAGMDLCGDGQEFQADRQRVAGRTRVYAGGPEVSAAEVLTKFAPDQAKAYLAEVRARVAGCPRRPDLNNGGEIYTSIVDSGFAGTDSIMIYLGGQPAPDSYPQDFRAVVRVDDYIFVVSNALDLGASQELCRQMAIAAAAKLG